MKDLWGKADGAVLVMAVFLLVVFGMLLQKALSAPDKFPLQPDITKEWDIEKDWELERKKRQRRWQDYQDRRDNSDSGIPDYQYAKRLKYGQKKAA